MTNIDPPPAFEGFNLVDLVSVDDSKISNVHLYAGRAEITRLFRFAVKTGQNHVRIAGLPNVMDKETLRVEGRGKATIHDVTISEMPSSDATISTTRAALIRKRDSLENALERCKAAKESIGTYLRSLNAAHVDVTGLPGILAKCESEGERLDDRILDLQTELERVEDERHVENQKKYLENNSDQLTLQVVIGVFSESEGEVEVALIYAVSSATWNPGYDIRVHTQTKETSVELIYKATITQSTGEAWNDVPLTLETVTPTFGVGVPELQSQHLSVNRPIIRAPYQPQPIIIQSSPRERGRRSRSRSRSRSIRRSMSKPASRSYRAPSPPVIIPRGFDISSNGSISATFSVPGLITVPSDGQAHNVTIVQLELEASLSWIAVPRLDTKTHLNAKIENASEYTFLRGTASVYVDGSFISKSQVPAVSPQESFDCPLGLDPSIRITYHPHSKNTSKSGFYQKKTTTHTYTQIITIYNTKTTGIDNLKVIDRFPVSQDSVINVKYISPALSLPSTTAASTKRQDLTVAKGVVAQWDGAEDPDAEGSALGKDGKFNWVCSIPAQEKVNLVLKWDVIAPANVNINGL